MNSDIYAWIILPLFIILARIFDVTLQTMRVILVARGQKKIAPVIGFFEVIIWLFVISQVMQNLNNIACYIAYGIGFALGTFIGMWIEEQFIIGFVMIRIITRKESPELITRLREMGYELTVTHGESNDGPVDIIYVVERTKNITTIQNHIKKTNPKAFFSVEPVKSVNDPNTAQPRFGYPLGLLKGKKK